MLARHLMTTEIFSLAPDISVINALREFKSRRIRRAPILNHLGQLMGIVTERDLLRATPGTVEEFDTPAGRAACTRSVDQIASKTTIVGHPCDHIEDLANLFLTKKIGGVPVVDRGKVVGMLTETDIFRAVVGAEHLEDTTRITIQRSTDSEVTPALEVIESLDLSLIGLTQYPGPDEREVVVIRVRGERADELCSAITQGGWLLLDRRSGKV